MVGTPEMASNQSGAIKIALQWAFLGWAILIFAGASWGTIWGPFQGSLTPLGASGGLRSQTVALSC